MTPGQPSSAPQTPRRWWQRGVFILIALALLAYNLRPTALQIGPVLPDLQADLGMDGVGAGVLTSLPTICFAVFGVLAPGLARRLGTHRLLLIALVALCLGSMGRTFAASTWPFMGLSTLALAGLALGNVLAPSVVRLHFPGKVGLVTALYSLVLALGVAVTSVITVPLSRSLGGWRPGLLAISSVGLVALAAWAWMAGHDRGMRRPEPGAGQHLPILALARTRLGWSMAIFFGLQSAQAYSIFGWMPSIYMSAGLSQLDAGWMLGLITGVGVPLSFLWPAYMSRQPRPVGLQLAISAFALVGYGGMLVAPTSLPWLWAVCMAIGTSSFPLLLAMFGLKAHTAAGTAVLSGFAQGFGYLIALPGPFTMGLLNQITGGWSAPLWLLIAMSVVMTVAGLVAITGPSVEEALQVSPG